MKIMESAENYLERILMIKEQKGEVHAVDIARALDITKASVSIALKKLREHGYITVAEDNQLGLTDKGYAIAHSIYERHKFLTDWLLSLGVNEVTAREDACKMEHGLSDESFEALKRSAKLDLAECDVCYNIENY